MKNSNENSKETFGQRLSRLRKNRGLTQEDIATKVNISAQAVSKWENDITAPDIDTILKLSDILSVSLNELMGKEEKSDSVTYLPEGVRKDPKMMMLHISITDKEDRVNVNLPLELVKIFIESGKSVPISFGDKSKIANEIDFNKILMLAEQGVLGELVSVDTDDGEHISVKVE